jgi:hypothetical protein
MERTLSWLHQYRRLRVRYERRADIHQAFVDLGCILICYKCLVGSFWVNSSMKNPRGRFKTPFWQSGWPKN